MSAEEQFHRSRRSFFFWHDHPRILDAGSPMSHMAHMVDEGVLHDARDPEYERIVRGYVMYDEMFIYQGYNFRAPDEDIDLRLPLRRLQKALDLADDMPVSLGVHRGEIGLQWPAISAPKLLKEMLWRIK